MGDTLIAKHLLSLHDVPAAVLKHQVHAQVGFGLWPPGAGGP